MFVGQVVLLDGYCCETLHLDQSPCARPWSHLAGQWSGGQTQFPSLRGCLWRPEDLDVTCFTYFLICLFPTIVYSTSFNSSGYHPLVVLGRLCRSSLGPVIDIRLLHLSCRLFFPAASPPTCRINSRQPPLTLAESSQFGPRGTAAGYTRWTHVGLLACVVHVALFCFETNRAAGLRGWWTGQVTFLKGCCRRNVTCPSL